VAGVAVEDALGLWACSPREVKRRIRPLFTQQRVAVSAGLFLDGLLGPGRRKTGWMRAEAAGDPGPWRQQAILGRGRWEADALRAVVREYAVESLADRDAVLVVDETGLLKQGEASCGVARQSVHGLGRQDRQLPDRGLRRLRVPARPRLHRPGAVPAEDLGRRSGPPGRRPRPARDRLRDQAPPRPGDDRAGDRGRGPVHVGGGRRRLRRGRDRDRLAAGRQGLRARRQRLPPPHLLGRQAGGGRRGGGDRPGAARIGVGASLGRRGHQGSAAPRLGLPGAGWPTSRPPSATTASPACGRAASRSGAPSPTAGSPSPRPGARPGPGSRSWSKSRGTAGRSRTASRPPRPSSASTTTRPAPGTAGTATPRS
jgi:hypothetical protein